MKATFLTLDKPMQFPVGCSLQIWQKQNLCLQLIHDHKKTSITDELFYLMLCQNKQKNELLPPTTDRLLQHLKQSNYKAFMWSHTLEALQDLKSMEGHGWMKNRKLLVLQPIKKALAPVNLLKLTMCQYKMSACQQNCSCSNTGLACTEGCFCMADDEGCKNLHGLTYISDTEESNKESTFEEELLNS